jgi:ribosomal protein S18 acetylase RimI-like enzyme
MNKNSYLKAIIIKGNPKYINNSLARNYYKEIEKFLKDNGVKEVHYDSGEALTIPDETADLYVGHSRGTSRRQYMSEEKQKVFLMFGVPEGIIDPVDLKWCKEVWVKGTDQQPPKEHFILIPKQKEAILNLIKKVKNVSLEELTDLIIMPEDKFETIPEEILDRANTDPILSGYINKGIQRVGIYFDDLVVGFYSPVEEEYKGKTYWRTGNIYVLPEYRNMGLASKVILDFFSDKENGLAHIAENNPASLKAFLNAGFKNIGMLSYKNPKGKNLYLMIKEPLTTNSFTKWN